MLIDWFTTIAQIINFLILVFLLKHFLYGPIIRAMDRREQKIADRLSDARSTKEEAEKQKNEYLKKSDQLEQEKKSILEEARENAEQDRKEMQREIRREMEEARRRWRHELAKQQQTFLDELGRRVSGQIMQTANRALHDLADQELQENMIRVFIARLKELDRKTIQKLRHSLDEKHPAVTVTGAFAIEGSAKQQLTRSLHEVLGKSVSVRYREDNHLLAGLRLDSDNEVVAWNLEEYLGGLMEEVSRFIKRESSQEENEE